MPLPPSYSTYDVKIKCQTSMFTPLFRGNYVPMWGSENGEEIARNCMDDFIREMNLIPKGKWNTENTPSASYTLRMIFAQRSCVDILAKMVPHIHSEMNLILHFLDETEVEECYAILDLLKSNKVAEIILTPKCLGSPSNLHKIYTLRGLNRMEFLELPQSFDRKRMDRYAKNLIKILPKCTDLQRLYANDIFSEHNFPALLDIIADCKSLQTVRVEPSLEWRRKILIRVHVCKQIEFKQLVAILSAYYGKRCMETAFLPKDLVPRLAVFLRCPKFLNIF